MDMRDSLLSSLVLGLLLVSLPPVAAAQDARDGPEEVMLRGWSLPEGAVITTVTHVRRSAELSYYGDASAVEAGEPLRALEIFTLRTDSMLTTLREIGQDGPLSIEQHILISDILEDIHEGDEIVDRSRRPLPLSGTRFIAEEDGDGGWTRRFLLPEIPSEEQSEALAETFDPGTPQYPERPVAVGETWEVGADVLARLYGNLVAGAPQRMTFQLDSTGTYLGRPAAFLSYGLDVTLDRGDGVAMRSNEVGVVIRLLDHFVDVLSQWQGTFRTQREGSFDDGQPYVALMTGNLRGQTQQFLLIPRTDSRSEAGEAAGR
jgi:hypothetical protein